MAILLILSGKLHIIKLYKTLFSCGYGQEYKESIGKATGTQFHKILKFYDHILNHHEKCIQRSTNKPGIGSLIRSHNLKPPSAWHDIETLRYQPGLIN